MSVDPMRGRDPARTYANDAIEVRWEPRLCIHTKACVRGLPDVFDPAARPWVQVDSAAPELIADAILACPTGALSFRRLDGGPQEEGPPRRRSSRGRTGRSSCAGSCASSTGPG